MSRKRRARLLTAALGGAAGLALASAAEAAPCAKLTEMTMPDVKVVSASVVAEGRLTPPGARAALENLPVFCRVAAVARPTPDSEINFEVWIPEGAAWNGKFQGVGTGGYQGSISYAALAAGVRRGYATASTDMGHKGEDLSFGQGKPERVIDWGYRAQHVTAVSGKLIVRAAQGRMPSRSYFVGCATGGHQAMSEVQRYPEDYDGVIAGDPAANRLHETAGYLWAWRALHDEAGRQLLSLAGLRLVTRSAVATCDLDDGVKDGVIDDPRACRFDVGSLQCQPGQAQGCLTAPQVAAVRKVYGGLRNPRTGALIFPGWSVGSEGYGPASNAGWGAFLLEPKEPMRSDVYKYFVFNDPNWDHRTFDFDRDVAYADQAAPYVAATETDFSPFARRGGKLILYSGWSDPVLPAEDVIEYYDEIVKAAGGKAKSDAFVRLFMVPGMGHCSGGPGPTSFDMLPALEAWVERGLAPTEVPASRPLETGGRRTRRLCAWPLQARWNKAGSSDDAVNFRCAPSRPSRSAR